MPLAGRITSPLSRFLDASPFSSVRLGLVLIVHLLLAAFFSFEIHKLFPEKIIGYIGIELDDCSYFLGTIDNYFTYGTISEGPMHKPFAGRMPGYGFPYLLIRLFAGKQTGMCILLCLQVVFSVVANVLLAKATMLLFKNFRTANLVLFGYAFFTPILMFNVLTIAESLSVSVYVCFFFFISRYYLNKFPVDLWVAGFFMGWMVFLRPFMGIFLPLLAPMLLLFNRGSSARLHLRNLLLFFSSFCLMESAWIMRNAYTFHRFIPLETPLNESYGETGIYRKSALSIRSFINSWGGEAGEFYAVSCAYWFHYDSVEKMQEYPFPEFLFRVVPRDSVAQLKRMFDRSGNSSLPLAVTDSCNRAASHMAERFTLRVKNTFPLYSRVMVPVKNICSSIFYNGTNLMILPRFRQMNLLEMACKVFSLGYYYLLLVGGMLTGIFLLIKKNTHRRFLLLPLLLPWIISATVVLYADNYQLQPRYYITAFPVYLIFLALAAESIFTQKESPLLSKR